MSAKLTKREIEIVRRFRGGESIAQLTRGIDVVTSPCPACCDPVFERVRDLEFGRDEVDGALRKAVQNVPAELWAEWTGSKPKAHTPDAMTCELCAEIRGRTR